MITFDEADRVFRLDTRESSYLMRVAEGGLLTHLYYGRRAEGSLDYLAEYTSLAFSVVPAFAAASSLNYDTVDMEYPTFGVGDFREPALEAEDDAGINVTDLRYFTHRIFPGKPELSGLPSAYDDTGMAETLEILLRDDHTGLEVTLRYSLFEDCDAIAKSVSVKNGGSGMIRLRRCLSSALHWRGQDYSALTLDGVYGNERHKNIRPLRSGKQSVDSLRGASGHLHNPFLAILERDAGEETGWVFGSALVYSGNFLAAAECGSYGRVRACMGIHPTAFCWELRPGDSFQAPEAVHVFSPEGVGGMSRRYHDFVRTHICRGEWRDKKRPLLVNNWEATYFDFTGEKLLEIAQAAQTLGIEMLVMDDGWFGGRRDDLRGLGDWFPNEEKLGMPLSELAGKVNALGLRFGIWVEPEMVNEDSNLFRAHPDWCMAVPGREPGRWRNQLVLNLALPEVTAYLLEQLSALLSGAEIAYVKWDFNRNLADVCCPALGAGRQGEAYHRYMLGLYGLLEQLTAAFPHVLFESCSGGGGRFDLGMLCYMPQVWTSDNTDAAERLKIQLGTSVAYPMRTMGSHVSVCPNHMSGRTVPMKTRGDVALSGTNGYELDLTQLSEADRAEVLLQVARYHETYAVVNFGDLYRLADVFQDDTAAWMFVAKDKAEALVTRVDLFQPCNGSHSPLRLRGLRPEARYRDCDTGAVYYGSALMNAGLPPSAMNRDFASAVWHFRAEPAGGEEVRPSPIHNF